MNRPAMRTVAVVSLLCAAAPAFAQETGQWGPYVSLDFGTTYFKVDKGRLDAWSASPSSGSSVDEGDRSFSLSAGFRFSRYLAAEATFLDLGSSAYILQDDLGATSLAFGSRGLALSMIGSWPFSPGFALEGRAGIYFGESKLRGWAEIIFDPLEGEFVAVEGSGGADAGMQLGVGLVATFGRHWNLRAGYDYLYGNAIHIQNTQLNSRMESSAGRFSLGIRYEF